MTLKDDIARWEWHKGRFEEIFGERSAGRFVERWPRNKNLGVLLSFDMQADVDAAAPWSSHPNAFWDNGRTNYCDATMRLYDALEGLSRVLRILDKYGAPATFMFCGLTAEWYPELAREVVDAGHEIGVHGHRHVKLCNLTPEEELEEITAATNAVREFSGDAALGWRSPLYSATEHTLEILRDLGYAWHSDFHDQDFPYVLTKDGRAIVEIPAGNDDWGQYHMFTGAGSPIMGGNRYGTVDGILSSMKGEFDVLYEESRTGPRVLNWAMHPKISGRPYPASVLDRLLGYIREHDGVWIATCNEVVSLA
jgi:peptidoglycan/xylan/chitin deacetylase (PgdA/CDA1 family)